MTPEDQPTVMSEFRRGERRIEWGAAALGASLLLQTAGIVWWGGKIDQRVTNLEQKVVATALAGETIARLDERTAAMQASIERIYTQIETNGEPRQAQGAR